MASQLHNFNNVNLPPSRSPTHDDRNILFTVPPKALPPFYHNYNLQILLDLYYTRTRGIKEIAQWGVIAKSNLLNSGAGHTHQGQHG